MTTADYNRNRTIHNAWLKHWGTPAAPCAHALSWVNVQRLERPDGTRYLSETCPDCGALLAERPAPARAAVAGGLPTFEPSEAVVTPFTAETLATEGADQS